MRRLSRENKIALVITVVLTALLTTAVYVSPGIYIGRQKHVLVSGAKVRWTRQQVVDRLGEPEHVAHSRSEFTGLNAGYKPALSYPVENAVLEYYRYVVKLYVYIGKDGRVTKVFLART